MPYIWPKKIEHEGHFYCFSTMITHEVLYFLFNGLFFVLYYMGWESVEKYKVQTMKWPWAQDKVEFKQLVSDSIKLIFCNHFLIIPILLIPNYLREKSIFRMDYESLPTHFEFFYQTILFLLIEDFLFYWSHRILHINAIYPYIHKVHHRYQNSISVAAEYAHPIEYVFGNIIPTNMGGLLMRSRTHYATFIFWISLRMYKSAENHSGYEFTFSPFVAVPMDGGSGYHNYHHLFFKGNYGSFLRIWDTICGTVNKKYLKLEKIESGKDKKEHSS